MEETAAFAGFSKYHFSRIFKEYYQLCMFQINTMKNRTGNNNKGEEQNQNK